MSLTEILVVVILVLVVMGPEKIPEMMRWIGRGMREIRRATNLFRDTMMVEGETLQDDLDPFESNPLDVPESEPPEPDRHVEPADAHAENSQPGARMRAVDLDPARVRSGLRRIELESALVTENIRFRYLSPPHRNLY